MCIAIVLSCNVMDIEYWYWYWYWCAHITATGSANLCLLNEIVMCLLMVSKTGKYMQCLHFARTLHTVCGARERERESSSFRCIRCGYVRFQWIKSNAFIIELTTKHLNILAICMNTVMILILNVHLFTLHVKPEFSNQAKME